MKEHYDIVIVGSGLGGLVSGIILAKEGYSVCVLEKNKQFGGNLQTFARNKTIFDTGVHYIGGLSKGQNLYQYFKYLGIIDDLELKKLDEDGFDIVSFDDKSTYRHAQGFDNFVDQLTEQFPGERKAIQTYVDKIRETCDNFPLYEVRLEKKYHVGDSFFRIKAKDYIDSLTKNEKLRAVLAGTNLLYAGQAEKTPFYVHALSVNSYIQSSYRCVNGGSQLTKLLLRELKKAGGEIYKKQEVVKITYANKKLQSAITKEGKEISGGLFISNIEPKLTIDLVGEKHFRKAYAARIKSIKSTIAAFSLYIVLKPETFPYYNNNFYHFRSPEDVWNAFDYTEETWPKGYMISMGVNKKAGKWADNLTVLTYMHYDEVEKWEHTYNTVAHTSNRGEDYENFKKEKTEKILKELEKRFPGIRESIVEVYTSTPLSYRDYIGSNRGSMYGYEKDVNNPLKSFISPKTKIENLYFTGQSLNMHGILGVTITAVLTCTEIIGGNYLVNKILEANKDAEG